MKLRTMSELEKLSWNFPPGCWEEGWLEEGARRAHAWLEATGHKPEPVTPSEQDNQANQTTQTNQTNQQKHD